MILSKLIKGKKNMQGSLMDFTIERWEEIGETKWLALLEYVFFIQVDIISISFPSQSQEKLITKELFKKVGCVGKKGETALYH